MQTYKLAPKSAVEQDHRTGVRTAPSATIKSVRATNWEGAAEQLAIATGQAEGPYGHYIRVFPSALECELADGSRWQFVQRSK